MIYLFCYYIVTYLMFKSLENCSKCRLTGHHHNHYYSDGIHTFFFNRVAFILLVCIYILFFFFFFNGRIRFGHSLLTHNQILSAVKYTIWLFSPAYSSVAIQSYLLFQECLSSVIAAPVALQSAE